MARHGVTYSEVSEAASQLLGQGRHPTIEQVRMLLGTGSSTTIAAHLKAWRENQLPTSLLSAKEKIPDELISMVKGLWERVIAISDEKLKDITTQYQTTLNELQENLDKYRHNNQRWQHLYHQWNKEKDELHDEGRQRDQEFQQLKEEFTELKSRYDHSIQQLVDKQDHIQGLQRLHAESRQSHEQFCQETQALRQLEQQQFNEQKQSLLAEMSNLNVQLAESKRAVETLIKQCRQHEHHLLTVHNEKNMLNAALHNKEKEFQQCDQEKQEHIQSSRHWEAKYHSLQQDMQQQTLSQQSEVYLLSQQLKSLQQSMMIVEAKNLQLQQEKIDLLQAKSALEGRIQQWELTENLIPA